jgi:hypothetical protein
MSCNLSVLREYGGRNNANGDAEMDTKNTGGSAFPVIWGKTVTDPGMTLRDWFAGQALAGLLANPEVYNKPGMQNLVNLACSAADAMIEACK